MKKSKWEKVMYVIFAAILWAFAGLSFAGTIALPQTGEQTCWDTSGTVIPCAGTGQDGDIQAGVAWPNLRFVDNSDGTVTDKLTGLMWTKSANLPAGRIYWQDALNYIASMNSANGGAGTYGYTDWRLPNFVEMESLENEQADYLDTWLIGQGFTSVQRNAYWSSTTYADDTTRAWVLLVQDQNIAASAKAGNTRYVWPVRSGQCGASGGSKICLHKTGQTISYAAGDDGALQKGVSWPATRFNDTGSGAVTDNLTGLMWTKNANLPNGIITWQQALDYVKTLNIGGYTDWRLPNRKELRSLFDYSQVNPALSPGYPFTDVKVTSAADFYWTSTSKAHVPASVWKVCMYDGTNGDGYKSLEYYFWPVRGDSLATVINLASLNATPKSHKVLLVWTTESEIDNGGFNIYRAESEYGQYAKINSAQIPAKGSSTQGATYEYVDSDVQNRTTYYYKLEDIDLNGESTMHGPLSATPRAIFGFRK